MIGLRTVRDDNIIKQKKIRQGKVGDKVEALKGIRILDLTRLLPGPYCSMMLADFGAEVIKIEEPLAGDYARDFPPAQNGFGFWHLQLNRNKKSLAVDLKTSWTNRQAEACLCGGCCCCLCLLLP